MNDKLSLQDLADILSRQANIDKKDAELFFKEFFQLILERIYENDSVKVKDFGTFKLTAISSRESVDVNTGDKIEIPAHYRFTFLPDKTLKEIVNKPFEKYQTVLLEDGINPSDINFEGSESDDDYEGDSIDDNEVSKIIQEQAKLIEEIQIKDSIKSKPNVESFKARSFSKIDIVSESKDKTNKIETISRPSGKPFVYTYSSSSTNTDKKAKDDVIMMTVRKDRISKIGIEKPTSTIKKEVSNKPFLNDHKDDIEELDDSFSNSYDQTTKITYNTTNNRSSTFTNNIDEDLIDINTTFNLPLDDDESENFDENFITYGPSTVSHNEDHKETLDDESDLNYFNRQKDRTNSFNKQNYYQDPFDDRKDPNRPLIPEDDIDEDVFDSQSDSNDQSFIIDQDQIDIDTSFSDVNDSSSNTRNIDTIIESKLNTNSSSNSIIEQVKSDPFFDYEIKSKKRSKLKKILPIVLLILVLIVVLGYNVYKLLNVKDDFDRYHNVESENFTMVDSFPSLYEDNTTNSALPSNTEKIEAYADTLSETNAVVVDDSIQNSTDKQGLPEVKNSYSKSSKDELVSDNMDSVSAYKKKSRQISNNLLINIANKAALFVRNKEKDNDISSLIEDQVSSIKTTPVQNSNFEDVTTVRLTGGMTLRSLANKYYGNGDYWVYIYTANKSKLPNPNSITIGISLVIPELKDFGISNPKDPTQLEKARRLEYEILN